MSAGRGIVVAAPSLDQHLGLDEGVEYLGVEQFVTQLAVDGVDGPRSGIACRRACAIRSHLAEFGVIMGQGIGRVEQLLERLGREEAERLPGEVRAM
jgi:hypothetical protein